MTLSTLLDAPDAGVPAGPVLAAAYGVGQRLVEDLVDQRALARARDPRDAREHPERELHVDALEVVLPRAQQLDRARGLPPLTGRLYPPQSGEKLAGHGASLGLQVIHATRCDDLAAVYPGPGSHVDQVVRRPDRLLVVLDDDERVPEVPQPRQRVEKPPVVPLVQPDRRLVEDVEHPDQPAPDLRGEPDALGLAPGQGAGRTAEGEVAEPDVHEEAESLADLLNDALGDDPLARAELDQSRRSRARSSPTAR